MSCKVLPFPFIGSLLLLLKCCETIVTIDLYWPVILPCYTLREITTPYRNEPEIAIVSHVQHIGSFIRANENDGTIGAIGNAKKIIKNSCNQKRRCLFATSGGLFRVARNEEFCGAFPQISLVKLQGAKVKTVPGLITYVSTRSKGHITDTTDLESLLQREK